jgi:hypothetical protein
VLTKTQNVPMADLTILINSGLMVTKVDTSDTIKEQSKGNSDDKANRK